MTKKLLYLEGIRGLASFIVYQLHSLREYNLPFQRVWMFYQNWTICVPLFFVLSGRVLTSSALRKEDVPGVVSSLIRRPFRLTLPVIGIMLVAWLMYHLNLFDLITEDNPCLDPDWSFCASPDKVAHSVYQMVVRPFLYVTNTLGVYPNAQSPIPIPFTAWTLPVEYANSNYIYLLTIVLINFKNQVHVQYLIMVGALLCTLFTHLWTAHFVVGLIFADLSNRGILERLKAWKWMPYINGAVLMLVGYLTIQSPISIGPQVELWVKSWQVGYDTKFGSWSADSHLEEKPTVLLLCSAIMLFVETTDILQWFLGLPVFVFLGRISFMLYLFHPFFNYSVQPNLVKLVDIGSLGGQVFVFVTCSVLVCIASEVLTVLIDVPVMNVVVYGYKRIFVRKWIGMNGYFEVKSEDKQLEECVGDKRV
ncbi:acyltransferase 3 [Globomyces pollinis-pini]|nr:acyltransferase 3 [Globomyces pollinis-pini]